MNTYNFPPTSRYYAVEVASLERPDGTTLSYLRRRFVPQPERFALLREHRVNEGERPDHIAAQYLGNAEMFWQVADANGVMRAEQLTDTVGRSVRITLPAGIPGTPNA